MTQLDHQPTKKLIEVAMPVKEVSAESVRDKSIRHGHISTLHLWWARRPLPVCRAVVFASLVPDPLDEHCPEAFQKAIKQLLGWQKNGLDLYKPYSDIPFTAAVDPMEDNLRNRLLMFIGKFSEKFLSNGKQGKATPAKDQLSDWSLIKWDNKNKEEIINLARRLIWVAHNSEQNKQATYQQLSADFDRHYQAIKEAEKALYGIPNRHIETEEVKNKEANLQQAIDAFLNHMPKVFDPFAGGGAIPLEAARLGCRTFGNDINPVAHIIQKGSLEFPQKYGKPITFSLEEFTRLYGEDRLKEVPEKNKQYKNGEISGIHLNNRLSFDVEFYAKKLLKMAEDEIGHLYPTDEKGNKPVAYYWVRVATCSNPSCRAEVPLLKDFYLVKKTDKKVYLKPIITGNSITFDLETGNSETEGFVQNRKSLKCPCCGNVTSSSELKRQFLSKNYKTQLLAVIEERKGGKKYRLPIEKEYEHSLKAVSQFHIEKPQESLPIGNSKQFDLCPWGFVKYGDMFSDRQSLVLQTLVSKIQEIKKELNIEKEYAKAIITYLGILINRISTVNTSFGRWNVSGEKLEHPFSRQAIPMTFDYPESNPFCTSSGSAYNQLSWLTRYIESESITPFHTQCNNSSSGDISQFELKYLDAVITDPPYYDAIPYADLSDFFYVWLKRTIADLYPLNFAYPQTPKSEECTALKYHHEGSIDKAKVHFEKKLKQIFSTIEKQTKGIISIMFAHQSTEAWTTLCNSVLDARMNITSSWTIDTEMGARMIAMDTAALASSVTISCRPVEKSGFGEYRTVKNAILTNVKDEVKILYHLGFRGADLLTACFGKAVSEFGQYKTVEKADGTEVTVAELLEMAREAAFNAIVSDIDTDEITRFYIGWLNLFGFSATSHDDVRRITQIGLSIDANDLLANHILIRNGSKESLATYKQRIDERKNLGENTDSCTIDKVHKAMYLFGKGNRGALLIYIKQHANKTESQVWRVLNSLVEILPGDTKDKEMANSLLTNKENLIREAQHVSETAGEQFQLDLK